jgi:hypothetical protein
MARFGVRSRAVAFARPSRDPVTKPFERTGANGREHRSHLPCRRSWVRVPSSALKFLQIGLCRRQVGKRWLQRGCIRARIEPDLCPGVDSCEVLDAVRAPNASDGLPASQEILSELEVRSSRFISSPRRSSAEFTDSCRRSSSVRERTAAVSGHDNLLAVPGGWSYYRSRSVSDRSCSEGLVLWHQQAARVRSRLSART